MNLCEKTCIDCTMIGCKHSYPHLFIRDGDGLSSDSCSHRRFPCPHGRATKKLRCKKWRPNEKDDFTMVIRGSTFKIRGKICTLERIFAIKHYGTECRGGGMSLPKHLLEMFV